MIGWFRLGKCRILVGISFPIKLTTIYDDATEALPTLNVLPVDVKVAGVSGAFEGDGDGLGDAALDGEGDGDCLAGAT